MIKQRIKTYYYFYYFILLTFIALMATVVSSLGAVSEGRNANLWSRAVSFFLWFYLWGLWSPLIFWLTRKFNFESCRRLVRHLVIHGFFGILISITHFAAFLTLSWLLDPTYQERNSSPLPLIKSSLLGGVYLVGLIFYLLVVFAAQAYISRQNYAAGKKKAALLQSALVEAQLQALKMQLQPHFLFNTLNSISSLVLTNPPQAYAMIARLGDFLRLTLDHQKDQTIFLEDELRFLRSYLEIEQTRFSDRLQVKFDVAPEVLSAPVPHLVLQPIVENSIKHGIAHRSLDGIIEIEAGKIEDKLRLRVKNSESETVKEFNSDGTGLKNVRARLDHLYGNDYSFEMRTENGETIVTLLLPFKKAEEMIDD